MLSAMFPEEPAAESIESATLPLPPAASPNIATVKARKYSANVCNFARMVLIRPWPIVALRASNCSCKMRTWLAQELLVLAKSPDASESWDITN